ncbi:MAG: type I 3-dehydroquinate dehydratase [Methanobacterium sp.]|nr:type I 3-dehydroquinate dehydratase [Methanobacterium sp.]
MTDKPLICVPIFKEDLDSAKKTADKAMKLGADILELRIDALKNPDSDKIGRFMDTFKGKIIATNRKTIEGGFFKGSEAERTKILREVAEFAEFVDIELLTEKKYLKKVIKASKSTIISFHDFKKTPRVTEILEVVMQEKEIGDMAKFAVMPHNMQDTLIVFQVLSQVKDTIGISMGDLGSYTRVIAALFGSPLTFASIDEVSAPGQLDIESTKLFLDKFKKW